MVTFFISVSSFGNDPSGLFLWDMPIAKFPLNGLWAHSRLSPAVGVLPCASDRHVLGWHFLNSWLNSYIAVTRSSSPRLLAQDIPQEGEDDWWVGEAIVLLRITTLPQNGQQHIQIHCIPHKSTLLHHCKAQMVNCFVNFNTVYTTNNMKGRHSVGKMLYFQVSK
jgi:hypothetical protein